MAGIQTEYVDALGKRHQAPQSTIQAIEQAIDGHKRHRRDAPPLERGAVVTTEGRRLEVGQSDLRLEDGSTRTIDRFLPADVPAGYHEIQQQGGAPARLIVAPAVCHLPRSFRTWGWAIQLYAARSRR